MRILGLYDIHGNLEALDAVLADPAARRPDLVVIGGDAVPGPFAVAVIDRLDGLQTGVRWVRGNGEREVGDAVDRPPPAPGDEPALTARRAARELGASRSRALAALPTTVTVDDVLFCHATPASDEEIITRMTPDADLARALEGVTTPLVVAGHTHQQDDRAVGAVRFINAGSVGLPYEGDGAARWLWIEDGVPELRRTAYDAAGAGRRMGETGWEGADSIDAALVAPVAAVEVTRLFEGRRG